MTPIVGRAIHQLRDVLSEAMNLGFNLSEKLGWTRKIMGSLSESNEHAETSWNNFKQWFHQCFILSFHLYCSSHDFRFYDISKARSSTSDFERRRAESSGTRSFGRSDQSTGRAHVAWHPWMGCRDTMGYRWELLWWGWKLPSGKEQILVLPGRRWLQPRPLWNNATSELKLKACVKTLSILIHCKKLASVVLSSISAIPCARMLYLWRSAWLRPAMISSLRWEPAIRQGSGAKKNTLSCLTRTENTMKSSARFGELV